MSKLMKTSGPRRRPVVSRAMGIALSKFLLLHVNTSEAQIRSVNILRIYGKMATLMVGTRISRNELDYKTFKPHFQGIMNIAENLFEASRGQDTLDGYQFSFDMDMVAPMCYISSKCHNQEICTRALMMLLKCPRKGGVWGGLGVAKMTSLTPEGAATYAMIGDASKS
ncbi:hypothetical protein BJ878DRAFT_493760 [Calycina marina]|uniref:Uncharacterized protein n=1 Tax=Calycina marina TaxID=1763456 RepID=A0A9P8CJ71_9HELO|nr:hypothetical protein BJ878DRAFT_493760 [Calycina marina]